MKSHGHVTPNADGSRARCGGPTICPVCAKELAQGWPELNHYIEDLRKKSSLRGARLQLLRDIVVDGRGCDDQDIADIQKWFDKDGVPL